MSETSAQETKKKIRLTYIISAIAISCLVIGASMGIMISATTPNIPTVIEPGSMLSSSYYTIFSDGTANIYVKNGSTGAIDYESTNPTTAATWALTRTPESRTVTILGNMNITSPIKLLRNVNLVFTGVITAWQSDFLIIGDTTHYLTAVEIHFNTATGVNQYENKSAVRFMNCISALVYFNNINLFHFGLYFDPSPSPGIGCGQNTIIGGLIVACDYGITWNATTRIAEPIRWAEGNNFNGITILASDTAGFYAPGQDKIAKADFNVFANDIDDGYGAEFLYEDLYGAHGGGINIIDYAGGQRFFLVYGSDDVDNFYGPGTTVIGMAGENIVQSYLYNYGEYLTIGLNNASSTQNQVYIYDIPRKINISCGGYWHPGEVLTVRMWFQFGVPEDYVLGPMVWFNFTETSYHVVTIEEIYSIIPDAYLNYGVYKIFFDARVNWDHNNPTEDGILAYVYMYG